MSKNKNTKYIQKDNNTDNRSEILSTAFMSLFLHGLHVLHALRISNIFRMGLDSIDLIALYYCVHLIYFQLFVPARLACSKYFPHV